MPIVKENEKEMYCCSWGKFVLEDIAIPQSIVAPPNLRKEDIPKYEKRNVPHYMAAESHFFEDRQWLRGCEEHREIKMEELNPEIAGPLERAFRWCYFQKFKDDESKVKKLEKKSIIPL